MIHRPFNHSSQSNTPVTRIRSNFMVDCDTIAIPLGSYFCIVACVAQPSPDPVTSAPRDWRLVEPPGDSLRPSAIEFRNHFTPKTFKNSKLCIIVVLFSQLGYRVNSDKKQFFKNPRVFWTPIWLTDKDGTCTRCYYVVFFLCKICLQTRDSPRCIIRNRKHCDPKRFPMIFLRWFSPPLNSNFAQFLVKWK